VFFAQIALDLPAILGLTMMAVGTTLQRGVGDNSLIVTVILLCTTTSLTTHITNVLRLLLRMRAQGAHMKDAPTTAVLQESAIAGEQEQKEKSSSHVHAIRYNRVIIGLIIAVMLNVFLNLAGLDSVQGFEFSALHQTWFAIVAFEILTCGDLSLEFFAMFTNGFNSEKEYFYKSVLRKSNYTGWLIVLGLLVLQLHQRYWLCPAYKLIDTISRPTLCCYN
jgi:hypothetical protein